MTHLTTHMRGPLSDLVIAYRPFEQELYSLSWLFFHIVIL